MRDLFLKDLAWKLLSLFLAVAIWLTVHKILTEAIVPAQTGGDQTTATTIIYSNQPVQVVSSLKDVHLYRVAPDAVTVTLTGPKDHMDDLQASQIRSTVNLSDTNMAWNTRWPVTVSPPAGITLIRVEPSHVNIIPPPGP